MSQAVDHLEPMAVVRPAVVEPGFDEFTYRPIPPLAPVSLFLAVCALSGLMSPLGLIFGLSGIVLGYVAQRQIRRSEGAFSGKWMADLGLMLSGILFLGGIALHIFWYATEVPEGFRRISFSADISKKVFVVQEGHQALNPEVTALDGESLFVKGFMYPELQTDGLESFILCRDNGQCCFGGQPKLTDMIRVKMTDGKLVRHNPNMVSVAGVFRLTGEAGELKPLFKLDASHFGPAKTSY